MPTAEEAARGQIRKPRKKAENSQDGRLARLFGAESAQNATMEWDDVDPRYLAWLVVLVTKAGGAVTFGRSRDAGALMVTFLLDGDRATTWIAPRDDVEAVLQQLGDKLSALTE